MRRILSLLLLFGSLLLGVIYGGWAYQRVKFPFDGTIPGLESAALRNTKVRFKPVGGANSGALEKTSLKELGYAEGGERAGTESGVVTHDAEAAWAGHNLYVTGQAELAVLMDMDGKELHRWEYDLAAELEGEEASTLRARFRRAHLFPNGDLLTVYGGHSWLAKFDKDSKLLWKRNDGFHHDLEVQPDGKIYAIASKAHVVDAIHKKRPVIEDFIVILDENGEELARQSVFEAFVNSDFAPMLAQMPAFGDILHTNTIEVLGEPGPGAPGSWKAGQVLISVREMDAIAVVDMAEARVVWAMTGLWDAQHQPTVLENGNLLIFDNYGLGSMSRVFEFAPAGLDIVWDYRDENFYSETCGSCIRLPNGNTLITESDAGTAFEVTPAGKTVWRFVSPHRAGENGDQVATLFEVERYAADYLDPGVLAE